MSGLARSSWACLCLAWWSLAVGGQTPEPEATPKTESNPCKATQIDKDRLIFEAVEFDAPVRGEDQNRSEFDAYNELVLFARQHEYKTLVKCARKDVTFKDLLPRLDETSGDILYPGKDFQYDLLYFEGRLLRLRDIKPTKPLADAKLTGLYEGWMFPTNGADPMCILISELPPGLETGLDFSPSKPVRFAGYFFKLIQYESVEQNPKVPNRGKVRRAPLLIGKTLELGPSTQFVEDGSGDLEMLLAWFGMLVFVGGGMLAMAWYFSRGDKRHKTTMETRRENNPFDPEKSTE